MEWRGTDYFIHVYSVLMPDEEGGREGKEEDGDRECYLLLFFFGFGFDFGFSGGMVRESEELGVCILSCLGVDFVLVGSGLRLGCKSTLKGSRRLEDRDG